METALKFCSVNTVWILPETKSTFVFSFSVLNANTRSGTSCPSSFCTFPNFFPMLIATFRLFALFLFPIVAFIHWTDWSGALVIVWDVKIILKHDSYILTSTAFVNALTRAPLTVTACGMCFCVYSGRGIVGIKWAGFTHEQICTKTTTNRFASFSSIH